jgi:hypothetical protein
MPSSCSTGDVAAFATVGANGVAAAAVARGAGAIGPMASRQRPHAATAAASPKTTKKTGDLRGAAFIEGVSGRGTTERLFEASQQGAAP